MFGANKDLNHLNQQYVIKCHICGSSHLRYIGLAAPSVGYASTQQAVYVCHNGHDTWGAIDQWNVKGQSDESTANVQDCCCEGRECDFPKSIMVEFRGVKGVQLIEANKGIWGSQVQNKESWDHSWDIDIKSRFINPFRMCEPCNYSEFEYDEDAVPIAFSSYYFGYDKNNPEYVLINGNIVYNGNGLPALVVWPYRIPTFDSTNDAPVRKQLFYDSSTGKYYAPDGSIGRGQCECLDLGDTLLGSANIIRQESSNAAVGTRTYRLFCGDPHYGYVAPENGEQGACFPICSQDEACFGETTYPPCLEVGTHKCFEHNAKYRVPCSNPTKKFTIEFPNTQVTSAPTQGGSPVNPIYSAAIPDSLGNYCTMPFYVSPPIIDGNPPAECVAFNAEPGSHGVFAPILPGMWGCQVMGPLITKVDQPHCARRVKQPGMTTPYYAVNTDDLSSQLIILDRFYKTSDTYDYLSDRSEWSSTIAGYSNRLNDYPDLGLSDIDQERLLPFPWIANSGSLEEPELVAIIHSVSGTGGQIAFETFPVTIETNQIIDPIDNYDSGRGVYSCGFKHRIATHGYGVKYPLIDDPIWEENKAVYQYPVFLKGQGYNIGDKIEFRCWKQLVNYNSEGGEATPLTASQMNEQSATEDPVYQISKELLVATATISEVDSDGGILWYEFDEYDEDGNLLIAVGNNPCQHDLCSPGINPFKEIPVPNNPTETMWIWDVDKINPINTGTCPGCMSKELWGINYQIPIATLPRYYHNAEDALPRRWELVQDPDHDPESEAPPKYIPMITGVEGFPSYPSQQCIFTNIQDANTQYTKVLTDICEYTRQETKPSICPGEPDITFTRNFRDADNLTICDSPCSYKVFCSFPSLGASYSASLDIDCKDNCYCEPGILLWCKSNLATSPGDESWRCECQDYLDNEGGYGTSTQMSKEEYRKIQIFDNQEIDYERLFGDATLPDFCYSDTNPLSIFDLNESFGGVCRCISSNPGPNTTSVYASNHLPQNPNDWDISPSRCYPKDNTWAWLPENYSTVSCTGLPVVPENRPFYVGNELYPPRQAQYRQVWLPKPITTLEKMDKWVPMYLGRTPTITNNNGEEEINATNEELRKAKVAFLSSSRACNPLEIDVFGNSYKFPYADLTDRDLDKPCRTQNKYQGIGTLFVAYSGGNCTIESDIKNDNYCRVYGFYQQKSIPCDVVYKGQYILRASQRETTMANGFYGGKLHVGNNCEPLIQDISITLKKKEARFDITVGAPYDQDFLIPENLPNPTLGEDNFFECNPITFPYSDTEAKNTLSRNRKEVSRLFKYGFYDIERKEVKINKYIPPFPAKKQIPDPNDPNKTIWVWENDPPYDFLDDPPYESVMDKNGNLPQDPDVPQTLIIPDTYMSPVDGGDFYGTPNINQTANVWDYPDPRSIVRIGIDGRETGDSYDNPTYPVDVSTYLSQHHFPAIGKRISFQDDCPYPWEDNLTANYPEDTDFFCMFKNHSAELKLGAVKECEYCNENDILFILDYDTAITDAPPRYGSEPIPYSHYIDDSDSNDYLLFRIFGPDTGIVGIDNRIRKKISQFIVDYSDLFDIGVEGNEYLSFKNIMSHEYGRTIFSNMFFDDSAMSDPLFGITAFEILDIEDISDTQKEAKILYEDSRCENPKIAGTIQHIVVENGGEGYAFEIEERVSPIYVEQTIENVQITAVTRNKSSIRRRETYELDTVTFQGDAGCCYEKDDIIPIRFNDPDARRDGIYYDVVPTVQVTEVTLQDVLDGDGNITKPKGSIVSIEIFDRGSFYKYYGTGIHRAFPISIVVSNYWNDRNSKDNKTNIGRNARFRPVVGVDPNDPSTYGKIKRIEIDWGGIGYVEPNTYWMIHTELGQRDDWGDLTSGLDLQHLVDTSKHCEIQVPGGMNSVQAAYIKDWLSRDPTIEFGSLSFKNRDLAPPGTYDNLGYSIKPGVFKTKKVYDEDGTEIDDLGVDFTNASRVWYKTYGNQFTWQDKALPWSTVIQSGLCPFGPGGLLDRTYKMALVEEVDITSQQGGNLPNQPYPSYCDQDTCDYIINDAPHIEYARELVLYGSEADGSLGYIHETDVSITNGIWLTKPGPGNKTIRCDSDSRPGAPKPWICYVDVNEMPDPAYFPSMAGGAFAWGNGVYPRGHGPYDLSYLGCDVYTAYDAHRFAAIGDKYHSAKAAMPSESLGFKIGGFKYNDWSGTAAKQRFLINGCSQRETRIGWNFTCFGSVGINGNEPFGTIAHGWLDFRDQMMQDDCYAGTDYSMYAELIKYAGSAGTGHGYRAKMITYKMGGEDITMSLTSVGTTAAPRTPVGNYYCVTNTWIAPLGDTVQTHYQTETVISLESYTEICARYCGAGNGNSCLVGCNKGLENLDQPYQCRVTINQGECPDGTV